MFIYSTNLRLGVGGARKRDGKKIYTCAIRPTAIYGPGEERHLPKIFRLAQMGLLTFIIGEPRVKNDLVYADNLILALLLTSMGLLDDIPGRKGTPVAAGPWKEGKNRASYNQLPLVEDHNNMLTMHTGANKISDEEFLKSKWSTVAREVTLVILKGLDIFQSPAAAVASVVANVAERFDEIPAIDRECIDLLEEMLELVKFFKRIKDRQLDLDKQMLETISNAVESAITGAIVFHSIIRWKTTRIFPLTKVILEELGYVKDKICSSDRKLKICKSKLLNGRCDPAGAVRHARGGKLIAM
ncbi:hypothetical protein KI387_034132, partial [Taxus chinensis]